MTAILARNKSYSTISLIILMCVLLLCSCGELSQKNRQKVNKALADSLTSTTQTTNLTLTLIEDGIEKIQLSGKYARTFTTKKTNETRISGPVKVLVYDSTHSVKIWASSDSAVYYTNKSEFKLFGNVKIRTRSKKHLYSEYLDWHQTDHKISTPRFFTLVTPSDSITGIGFKGSTDLSNYTMKNVSGKVTF